MWLTAVQCPCLCYSVSVSVCYSMSVSVCYSVTVSVCYSVTVAVYYSMSVSLSSVADCCTVSMFVLQCECIDELQCDRCVTV